MASPAQTVSTDISVGHPDTEFLLVGIPARRGGIMEVGGRALDVDVAPELIDPLTAEELVQATTADRFALLARVRATATRCSDTLMIAAPTIAAMARETAVGASLLNGLGVPGMGGLERLANLIARVSGTAGVGAVVAGGLLHRDPVTVVQVELPGAAAPVEPRAELPGSPHVSL